MKQVEHEYLTRGVVDNVIHQLNDPVILDPAHRWASSQFHEIGTTPGYDT